MVRRARVGALVVVAGLALVSAASGQPGGKQTKPPADQAERAAAPPPAPEPKEFTTEHSLKVEGNVLRYHAVAGETFLRDDSDKPEASVFSVGYFLDGVADRDRRPITFLFNGGPGSSATWLHLGAFGPERLDLMDAANPGAPPYTLAPNPYTLLGVSDLVFVDPVGTGYSHALGGHEDSEFWGVDSDADSMARFIRAYLTDHDRWGSPKYLAGESYGTTRVSLLVRDLELPVLDSVALNGVILLSSALDVRIFLSGVPGNDLVYVTDLPTYAATAYYHDALPEKPADFDAFLAEARRFAATDYLEALFQGDALPEARAQEIASRLHHFTGLSERYLLRSRLRVDAGHFTKELLRDRGEVLGLHDTRYAGRDPDEVGATVEWDPFISSIAGPFVATIHDYLEDDLGVHFDRPYTVFSPRAGGSWKRSPGEEHAFTGYLYTVPYLAQAAATNKDFRIFVATGYYDLTTAFFGVEHTFSHSGIDPARISLHNYAGGHMMYLYPPSLDRLSADVRAFIGQGGD